MARLASAVHVRNPKTGERNRFAAGDTPPNWAAKLITNPKAWEGDEPEPESEGQDDDLPSDQANKPEWEEAARKRGLDPTGLNKEEIIEALREG